MNGPQGVGGWLALLVFGLGVGMPLQSLYEVGRTASGTENAWAFGGSLTVLVGFATGGVYAALALLLRWPRAPRTAMYYIWAVSFLGLMGVLVMIGEGNASPQTAGQLAGLAGWGTLWTAYLLKSRRVKNTYPAAVEGPASGRRAVRLAAVGLAAVLLCLGGLAYSQSQNQVEAEFRQITPYQWVKIGREMDPLFDDGFAASALSRVQSGVPDGTVTLSGPPSFSDLGAAFRTVVRYRAAVRTDTGETVVTDREVRSYYHSSGIAEIESTCVPAVLQCAGMQDLLASAERSLLPVIRDSQLAGILPGGSCSTESLPLPDTEQRFMMARCGYGKDNLASLTLTRRTLSEAQNDLQLGMKFTPEFRWAFVKRVRATP